MCATQVMTSYEAWVKLFEDLHISWQGNRIRSMVQNGVDLGNIKKLKCVGALFFAFSCAYWEHHTKWLHQIDELSKAFGHYSPLIFARLMIMLENLQEVKTMQSSNFDNHKDIREGMPADDHKNCIYGKETAKNQANDFFEEYKKTLISNAGQWMETNNLPLAIGGECPTSMIFAQWICDEDTIDLGEGMKYYKDHNECTIDLLRFHELLDALPEGIK